MPPNVTYAGGYIRYIKSKTVPVISVAEVQDILSVIQTRRLTPSLKTNREHISNLQARLENAAPRLCPKCGGEMVLRAIRSGENAGKKFWGCSQFPKCRAVQNVN